MRLVFSILTILAAVFGVFFLMTYAASASAATPPPFHATRACGFYRLTFPEWRQGPHLCSVRRIRHHPIGRNA